MRPNGRRAPPCSLRSLPPSGEKAYSSAQEALRGAEYSAPLAKAVLTQKPLTRAVRRKNAPAGPFSRVDCFDAVRPPRRLLHSWGHAPSPPVVSSPRMWGWTLCGVLYLRRSWKSLKTEGPGGSDPAQGARPPRISFSVLRPGRKPLLPGQLFYKPIR